MRYISRFFGAIIGSVASAVYGAAAGLMVGGLTTVAYFVVKVVLCLRAYTGADSKAVMAAIEASVSLGAKLLILFPAAGAMIMFVYAFVRICNRRDSFRRFISGPGG